ncbi:hypothetical protein LSM04_007730 [Trypanosoma melophagium]|uniref:uncharacterized protein n=1 Tax=Trypanosoma melophagium TaxID=715481 RepID=UPI00351A4554|nr:hypothetical protein LSM04_007730 [Trypanosoma melophagium]
MEQQLRANNCENMQLREQLQASTEELHSQLETVGRERDRLREQLRALEECNGCRLVNVKMEDDLDKRPLEVLASDFCDSLDSSVLVSCKDVEALRTWEKRLKHWSSTLRNKE